jgi:hypothetical protein
MYLLLSGIREHGQREVQLVSRLHNASIVRSKIAGGRGRLLKRRTERKPHWCVHGVHTLC